MCFLLPIQTTSCSYDCLLTLHHVHTIDYQCIFQSLFQQLIHPMMCNQIHAVRSLTIHVHNQFLIFPALTTRGRLLCRISPFSFQNISSHSVVYCSISIKGRERIHLIAHSGVSAGPLDSVATSDVCATWCQWRTRSDAHRYINIGHARWAAI